MTAMSLTSCWTLQWHQGAYVKDVDLDHTVMGWENAEQWRSVSDDPPTFVPVGWLTYPKPSTGEGEWMVDTKDGTRFFVPRKKFRGLNQQQWRTEAKKGINFNTEEKEKIKKNNAKTNALLPLMMMLEVIAKGLEGFAKG